MSDPGRQAVVQVSFEESELFGGSSDGRVFLWADHVAPAMSPRAGDDEDDAAPVEREGGGPPWDEQLAPGSADDEIAGDERAAGDVDDGQGADEDADDESEGDGVAGEFVPEGPVEPGTPTLENAVFVVVGAYLTVLAIGELLVGVEGYSLRALAAVTGAALVVSLVSFGFFGLLTPET